MVVDLAAHPLDLLANGRSESEDTFGEIYRFTGGVPRLVNTLCDTAMMSAFTAERDHVTLSDIASAVDELQWVEFTERAQQMRARQGSRSGTQPSAHLTHAPTVPEASDDHIVGRVMVATEGRTVQELPLKVGRIIIGRTPDNDLHVDSRFVSRHHCQIVTTPHGSVIEDLNSTNGIYLQGRRVRRHNLNDGDVIVLGKHELLYVDERAPHMRSAGAGAFIETMPGALPEAEEQQEEQ